MKLRKAFTLSELKSRNLLYQITNEHLLAHHLSSKQTIYTGFDPTAKSLHVGNLFTIVSLLHFMASGHQIIALIGGATGHIGDPSGKADERKLLGNSEVTENSKSIKSQLDLMIANGREYLKRKGLETDHRDYKTLNNLDWFKEVTLLDFLATTGRFSRVSAMLARDSVKGRMVKESGISYAEFSYQLLQAYDFLHLFNNHNCTIQLGGSDQWGNITAGLDLIKKSREMGKNLKHPLDSDNEMAFGITIPLITTNTGEKFGKSEGNAIWLDKSLLSVYDFYQFFRKTPDSEVEKLLNYFTFLRQEEINEIMQQHSLNLDKQHAQKILAKEVCELVHGQAASQRAEFQSQILFGQSIDKFKPDEIAGFFAGDKRFIKLNINLMNDITALGAASGLLPSKSAVFKMIKSGGFYVNGKKWIAEDGKVVDQGILVNEKILLLRAGKSNYRIVYFEG